MHLCRAVEVVKVLTWRHLDRQVHQLPAWVINLSFIQGDCLLTGNDRLQSNSAWSVVPLK